MTACLSVTNGEARPSRRPTCPPSAFEPARLSVSSLLVTGGTGSLGRELVRAVLQRHPEVTRIVVFSRDELKQSDMASQPVFQDPRVRFFIGDVRDQDRVRRAMEGIEGVVHAAALKQVPAIEYNPFEAIKTNILGAQNVIESALDLGVRRVVALSTDKASAPVNLYGATKLCSDKLFVAANNMRGARDLKLAVVRYGNVLGSRGSVIPLYLRKARTGSLPVTDTRMTRFSITLAAGVGLCLMALEEQWGGELFVPKLPSYRLSDVATAVAPGCAQKIIGLRPGEKLHEEMITPTDALGTIELPRYYVILPSTPTWSVGEFIERRGGRRVDDTFHYASGTNTDWLDVDQLRELVRLHVDPDFVPWVG
jgi:UDP-N-acetylglucosamine 4,6-dehydratase (inverting)